MYETFFETLGIADQERIHTQFLAWILAPGTSPLSSENRCKIIGSLLAGYPSTRRITSCLPIRVATEIEHMDLLIILEDAVLVFENKMKSRLHSNQLGRYNTAIDELEDKAQKLGLWEGRKQVHKFFLSFSGETNVDEWLDLDFSVLAFALEALGSQNPIFDSYVAFCRKLLGFRNEYLSNHVKHSNVEANAGLKNLARMQVSLQINLTELERFLLLNKLDTLFGESLLHKLAQQINVKGLQQIGETRGHSLLETTMFEFRLRCAPQEAGLFRSGTQLQRNAFKLNIGAGESYNRSKREWIQPIEELLDREIAANWPEYANRLRTYNARSKAYRSWIYSLGPQESLATTQLEQFSKAYTERLNAASATWRAVLSALATQGIVYELRSVDPRIQVLEPELGRGEG